MKTFAIFKNKDKKNENQPDYNISVKHGEHFINVGGCWIKDSKGNKYFSCKLSNGYKDIPGFEIVPEKSNLTEEEKAQIQALRAGEETKNDIKPDQVPF